eukprot:350000-Chlamydomonas_euryale.AAC.1
MSVGQPAAQMPLMPWHSKGSNGAPAKIAISWKCRLRQEDVAHSRTQAWGIGPSQIFQEMQQPHSLSA